MSSAIRFRNLALLLVAWSSLQGPFTLAGECEVEWLRKVYGKSYTLERRDPVELHRIKPWENGYHRVVHAREVPDREHPGETRMLYLFKYYDEHGRLLTNRKTIARLDALRVSPTREEAWYSDDPLAHIQAISVDSEGNPQYRYHDEWIAAAAEEKWAHLEDFGKALPDLRAAVARGLRQRGLTKDRVLAAVVRLLDTVAIRIGGEKYAEENRTYGLTTMPKRYFKPGPPPFFQFRAKSFSKSNQWTKVEIVDPAVLRLIEEESKVEGKRIFQWVDENGEAHQITADMVNDYLQRIGGGGVTAKNYRTWKGTVSAALSLMEAGPVDNPKDFKNNVDAAIRAAGTNLQHFEFNTAKKNYIDPSLIHLYADPAGFADAVRLARDRAKRKDTLPEEELVLLVRQWVKAGRIP